MVKVNELSLFTLKLSIYYHALILFGSTPNLEKATKQNTKIQCKFHGNGSKVDYFKVFGMFKSNSHGFLVNSVLLFTLLIAVQLTYDIVLGSGVRLCVLQLHSLRSGHPVSQ